MGRSNSWQMSRTESAGRPMKDIVGRCNPGCSEAFVHSKSKMHMASL